MATSIIPLSDTPAGITYNISGGSSIGLNDINNVTEIPSFTGIVGSAVITVAPFFNGCEGTPLTFNYTILPSLVSASIQSFPSDFDENLPYFTFDITGIDENNTNGGISRATFYLQNYTGGKVDWGNGLVQTITTASNTLNYGDNDAKKILVYNLPLTVNYIGFNTGSGNITDFNINNMLDITVSVNNQAITSLSQIKNDNIVNLWFSNTPLVFTADMFDFVPKLHGLEIDDYITGVLPDLSIKQYLEWLYIFSPIIFPIPYIYPVFKTHYFDYEVGDIGLTEAQVDAILVYLDTLSIIDGDSYIYLEGNTPPSSIGITAKNSLILKGAIVDTD